MTASAGAAADAGEAQADAARRAEARAIADSFPGIAQCLDRMFMPLPAMIADYERQMGNNPPLAAMLAQAKASLSATAYGRIQDAHLHPESLTWRRQLHSASSEIKYLDFPYWVASKFRVAQILGLEGPPRRVLDIGAGPGHFGHVCRYLGHDYLGLDLPTLAAGPVATRPLYDDLCEFFGVRKLGRRITAHVPLGLPGRYDLLTCLMGNFNVVRESATQVRPWGWAEWRFLLGELIEHNMAPGFRMYFQVGRSYVPPEVWVEIERRAVRADRAASVFSFDATLADRL